MFISSLDSTRNLTSYKNSFNNCEKNKSFLSDNEIIAYLSKLKDSIHNSDIKINEISLFKNNEEYEDNQCDIKINSTKISFYKCAENSKQTNLSLELYLPLTILPFLYLLNQPSLKKFICLSLKIKENIKETSLNIPALNFLMNNLKEFDFSNENRKISLLSHKKNYKFLWMTNDDLYEVIIHMPTVELFLKKNNTKIIKYLDEQTLFNCLLIRSDWQNCVLSYLFNYKEFRTIMNNNLSKYKQRFNNKTVYIDNENEINPFDLINPNSYYFDFVYSKNEFQNIYLSFNPYEFNIVFGETNSNIKLNLYQTRIMMLLKEIYGSELDFFIRKLIDIKNNSNIIYLFRNIS